MQPRREAAAGVLAGSWSRGEAVRLCRQHSAPCGPFTCRLLRLARTVDSSFPRGLSLGQHMAGSGMTTPQPGPGIREAFPGGTGQAAGGSTSLQVEVLRTTVTTTRASGKEPPANEGDIKDAGSGRSPGGGHGNPLQYSCPENPQGRRSLAGHTPWSRKDSDTTEATWHAYTHAPFS